MNKKLFSIALIVVLISFTIAPLWGYSCFVYGADNSGSSTEQEKLDASLSTYFNYRGGYFVASAGGAGVALQMARNYINDFYVSSANNTGIHSTADFLAHVTFRNTNDHWGIYIDNNGVVFLDNLVKWLLGKNEFPNLYSGGAWGQNTSATSDDLYNGYLTGNSLFYILDFDLSNNLIGEVSPNKVTVGTPVQGLYGNKLFDEYNLYSPGIDWDTMTMPIPSSYLEQTLTIQYTNNYTKTLGIRYSYAAQSALQPFLAYNEFYGSGYTSNACRAVYSKKGNIVVGCPAFLMSTYNGSQTFYYGWIAYDVTNDLYYYKRFDVYNRNDAISDSTQVNIDFDTDQFDRNDVGSESGTAPGVEFVPKEKTENNTYNYYNYNDYSEKQFIENYVEKYVVKKTIIDGSSQDPGDNPGGGGGSVTPGTGSGNITPDGNGGYNFNLPDIGWPDFSGFDFNISGLSEKFPFSIPFDLMAFFTVLNAEPETPEIQGDIDLGIVNWEIDWDLHDFDTLAALLRNLEFIGFCISLILITRSIIKG